MALRNAMLPSPIVILPSMSRTVMSPAWRSRILSSAMIWDLLLFSLKFFRHSQCRAAFRPHEPFDIVHEVADQEDAPTRTLHEVGRVGRIGHAGGVESMSLIRNCFADRYVNPKSGVISGTASLDEIGRRGRSVGNRLNVAGQNESRRLFGHRRRGLSRWESRWLLN